MNDKSTSSFTRELFLASQGRKSLPKPVVHTFVNNDDAPVPEVTGRAYVQNMASISFLEAKIDLGTARESGIGYKGVYDRREAECCFVWCCE